MPERLRPYFTLLPAGSLGDMVQRLPDVGDHAFVFTTRGREEERAQRRLSLTGQQIVPKDLLKLGRQGYDAVTRGRLQPSPIVRPERDRLPLEAHVVHLKTQAERAAATLAPSTHRA